jgi:hypothetical protein
MEFNITAVASIDPMTVLAVLTVVLVAAIGTVRCLGRMFRPFTLLPGTTRLLSDQQLKALEPLQSDERDIEHEGRR